MIVSKSNLQAVMVTKVDSKIPAIDNVHIAEDGSTIGIGGKMMLAIGPVKNEVKKKLGNVLKEQGEGGLTISSETIKEAIKNIPADRKFAGLLEHCNVERIDDTEVVVTMTDGKRNKKIRGRLYTRPFLPYKTLMKNAMETSGQGKSLRLVMNLKRLILLLQAIEKSAPDTSGDNPVWIEFTEQNYVILRSVNMVTGQRCVGIMSPYEGIEGKWLDLDEWEQSFLEDESSKKAERSRPVGTKVKHKKKPVKVEVKHKVKKIQKSKIRKGLRLKSK